MIEGFDTRTLTVIITLFAIVHGIALCCYAKTHASFRGFWHIGSGFLILASGFALVSFRAFLNDWLTITLSGMIVIFGIRCIGIGGLRFFSFPFQHYQRICNLLLILQFISSSYYVVVDINPQIRIVIICIIFATQSLYLSHKFIGIKDKKTSPSVKFLYQLFIIYGLLFLGRAIWTVLYYQDASPQAHTIAHITSLMAFLLMVVLTSSIIIWSASDRLRKELEKQATIDPLTQIYNRRALESIAYKEIARAQREAKVFSVIMLDIDHFKLVNDKHGHQYGDQVLTRFCQLVAKNLRKYDVFARYGGEEFVLLIPNSSRPKVLELAEKLRVIISQSSFQSEPDSPSQNINEPITASFGVTDSSNVENTNLNDQWGQLLAQADKALYQAKQQGRNRVVDFADLRQQSAS